MDRQYGLWHSPSGTKDAKRSIVDKMAVIQNKRSRVIAGAYRATSIEVLRAETIMPSTREYLDQLQCKARSRLKTSGPAAFIKRQCK